MSKKTVASLQKGEGRTYSKIIKVVKSPKTGAYTFQEQMVPNDAEKDALKKVNHSFERYTFKADIIAERSVGFDFFLSRL